MAGSSKPNISVNIRTLLSIPGGYILGRTAAGQGPVELIPISGGTGNSLGAKLVASGTVGTGSATYLVTLEYVLVGGTALDVDQFYYLGMIPASASFPSASTAVTSKAICRVAPLINVTFYVVYDYANYIANGSTASNTLASVAFTAGSTTGTITWIASPPTIATQTSLYVFTSSTFTDKTIEGFQLILVGDYVSG